MLFLADGRIVDETQRPTAEAVLERMKRFDTVRVTYDGREPDGSAADTGGSGDTAAGGGPGEVPHVRGSVEGSPPAGSGNGSAAPGSADVTLDKD